MQLSRRDALRLIGLATASGSLCGGLGASSARLDQSIHQDTPMQINKHLFLDFQMSRFSRVPFGTRRIGIRSIFSLSTQTASSHGFGERRD